MMSDSTVRVAIYALLTMGALSIIEIGVLSYKSGGETNPVLAAVAGGAVTGIGSLISTISRKSGE